MGIEGFLDIQLTMNGSGRNDVEIRSSRPVHASRVFHGKSVNESLSMLPLLFNICGVAQACAGVRACEQALSLEVPLHMEQVRDKLVNMETLREHLWRIFLDWPVLLDKQLLDKQLLDEQSFKQPLQTLEMSEIIKYQQDHRKLLTAGSNPFLLGQDIPFVRTENCQPIRKLSQLLEKSIFAMSPAKWLEIDSLEKLQYWFESSETIAAQFLKKIHQNQWQDLGRNNIKGLLPLETEALDIDTLYAQFENENFVKQPLWHNKCYETSSLTRVDSPLLQLLHRQWGNGLMSRLVARLTEMAQIVMDLLDSAENPVSAMSQERCDIQGSGIGVVSAARGLLIHHVGVEQEQIKKYQIVAPTEWNFHPQGVVTQSLASLPGDLEQINIQADLLINAIDPCVGYKFFVR